MQPIHSFSPVVNRFSTTLILGSIPGKASLQKQQYYGHSRNLFWRFMEIIAGVDASAAYEKRIEQLLTKGLALWDVLKSCTRPSSLDADIVTSSIVTNEFVHFFAAYPSIRTVYFNGTQAAEAFRRYVLPDLLEANEIHFCKLPSTSPANASMSYDQKLEAWYAVLYRRHND